MPEHDNLGLCCSFHGSCSNHWTRAAKKAGASGDIARQQRVVRHETDSQGKPGEGMSNCQCLAAAQTGAPRGAVSFPLGEREKRHQPWSMMMPLSSFLNAGGKLFKPWFCFFFYSHCQFKRVLCSHASPIIVTQVAEYTMGAVVWPQAESSPVPWACSAQPAHVSVRVWHQD